MKILFKKAVCILVISILLFIGCNIISISAVDEFDTIQLTESEINRVWQSINLQLVKDVTSINEFSVPIVNFDVSKSRNIVMGLSDKQILVLDPDGNISNLFTFETYGSFYVKWNGNNLLLFLVRSSIIVEFTLNGDLVSMVDTDDNSINNNALWNEFTKVKNIKIDNYDYYVENKMGFFDLFACQRHNRLITIDPHGNKAVLYDVNNFQVVKIAVMFFVIITIIAVVLYKIFRPIVLYCKNTNNISKVN